MAQWPDDGRDQLTPSWQEFPYLIDNDFHTLAERQIQLKLQRDEIDAEMAEHSLELAAMLATVGVKSVVVEDHRITLRYSSTGGQISKERLLNLGVPGELVRLATVPKERGTAFVSIHAIEK